MEKKRRGTGLIILMVMLGLIVVARLSLPMFILNYVNRTLDEHPDYDGHVNGISLSILAGSYSLNDIEIHEVNSRTDEPLFAAEELLVNIDYRALFRGKVVGEIELNRPVVNFITGPTEEESQEEADEELAETVDEMVPVRIDKFRIREGKINYRNITMSPQLNLQVYNLNLTATNLTTAPAEDELLPSEVNASASTTGEGRIDLTMRLNPLAEVPTFDMNFELQDMQLSAWNHFIREQARLDVVGGTFNLHTEIAAQQGYFKGYAKPVIDGLEITPLDPEDTGLLQRIYESAATVIRDILEAPGKEQEQIATRIPLEGRFDDPDADIWSTVMNLLRNAFIEALVPSIDHSINIGQVREVIKDRREE
jgi:hypothetical protein